MNAFNGDGNCGINYGSNVIDMKVENQNMMNTNGGMETGMEMNGYLIMMPMNHIYSGMLM